MNERPKTTTEIVREARLSLQLKEWNGLRKASTTNRPQTPTDYVETRKLSAPIREERYSNFQFRQEWGRGSGKRGVEHRPLRNLPPLPPTPPRPSSTTRSHTPKSAIEGIDDFRRERAFSECGSREVRRRSVSRERSRGSLTPVLLSESVREEQDKDRPASSASVISDADLIPKDIRDCLEHLSPLTNTGDDSSEVEEVVGRLGEILHRDGYMSRRKWRGRIPTLRALFGSLNPDNPKLTLHIALICFSLGVSGSNLSTLLEFVLHLSPASSDDPHYPYLLEHQCFEGVLRTYECVEGEGEAEILTMTLVLKTVWRSAGKRTFFSLLHSPSFLRLLHRNLFLANNQRLEKEMFEELLVYTTHLIRKLLEGGRAVRREVVDTHISSSLLLSLSRFSAFPTIVTNISRIFSKLSIYEECCEDLVNSCPELFNKMSNVLSIHKNNPDIVVRILFALGNVVGVKERGRGELFRSPAFVPTLLVLFRHYLRPTSLVTSPSPSPTPSTSTSNQEVLVKVVNILANLLIDPAVGVSLSSSDELLTLLLETLETMEVGEWEELVLNSLVTLHNLSFYLTNNPPSHSPLILRRCQIAQATHKVLMTENVRGAIEACNVLGNLSQHNDVQRWLIERKVHVMMVSLLGSSHSELVNASAGILVNICLTEEGCQTLNKHDVCDMSLKMLERWGEQNWEICALGCKLLFNFTNFLPVPLHIIHNVTTWLLNATDENERRKKQENVPKELEIHMHHVWDGEFCAVALPLLERLSAVLEPITILH